MLKHIPEKITVLFFATNPKNTDRLRLDEEVRSIQEMLRKSEHRDSISFESRWAVRPLDILQAINELNPDVIHFSGHGADTSELILENSDGSAKCVTKEAITQIIMTSSDKIHLIVFNTCFSYEQAQAVKEYVDAAIGMTTSISDNGACAFAAQFYSSLGFGLSLQKSFEQAKATLALESPLEQNIPELYVKDGIEPDNLFIVKPNSF
jgi:CHAT domain-containing protein